MQDKYTHYHLGGGRPAEGNLDQIICGDAFDLIKQLDDASVALTLTSPPYFRQRRYTKLCEEVGQEPEMDEYIKKLLVIFDECRRVTKPNGSIVWNLGDKYDNACMMLLPWRFALEASKKATLINTVMWVKTNPTPRQYKKRLVSAWEPFFHFVNGKDYCYELSDDVAPSTPNADSRIGEGYFKQIEASGLTSQEKENAKAALRKVQAEVRSGKLPSLRMKIRGVHPLPFGGQEGGRNTQITRDGYSIIRHPGGMLHPDYIEAAVENTHKIVGGVRGAKHPAIFPLTLAEYFIHLTTRPGDVVFDPFIGSGTTGVAAKKLNRHHIGFELCQEFADQARRRINET